MTDISWIRQTNLQCSTSVHTLHPGYTDALVELRKCVNPLDFAVLLVHLLNYEVSSFYSMKAVVLVIDEGFQEVLMSFRNTANCQCPVAAFSSAEILG
jgi:hypothetical protein